MADKEKVDKWCEYFKKENTRCITCDSTASGSGKKIESAIKEKPHLAPYIESNNDLIKSKKSKADLVLRQLPNSIKLI